MNEATLHESVYKGIPVSPGTAIGAALIVGNPCPVVDEFDINPADIDIEIRRFRHALKLTREQIRELQRRLDSALHEKHSKIFDAHLLITEDRQVIDEVEGAVKNELKNIDFIFKRTIDKYIDVISAMPDKYIRERASDIRDVASKIIINLHGVTDKKFDNLPGQRIIIAHELVPSDTATLDRENVLAFATEVGSRTSHTAIMARSMAIPAVVGVESAMLSVKNGDIVIVDGYKGNVIINPTLETLDFYARRESRESEIQEEILKESCLRPETLDRFRIQIAANIELPEDIGLAKRYGAAGVGLFRTEYLYLNRDTAPPVEEQFEIYKGLVSELDGYSLVVRTFDLGGDKLSRIIDSTHVDPNPFLGCRAIRLHLDYPELLKNQVRAILMASSFGDIKIMFPMIACYDEVGQLLGVVDAVKSELRAEKISFNEDIEIGIMIETPSAALIAEQLAPRVDFFSIGTNDLVQYTLAVDRNNEKVAYLYQPSHPAILALIHNVVEAATQHGKWVGVCGEMAADPRYIPLLVGMGIHELSMSAQSIGPIRRLIRRLHMHDAETVFQEAIKCSTADEVLDISEALLYKIAPDIMNMALFGE
jgi:phosphoenolpyruvate-protein phosphotransferase (PTS system enzyme I)